MIYSKTLEKLIKNMSSSSNNGSSSSSNSNGCRVDHLGQISNRVSLLDIRDSPFQQRNIDRLATELESESRTSSMSVSYSSQNAATPRARTESPAAKREIPLSMTSLRGVVSHPTSAFYLGEVAWVRVDGRIAAVSEPNLTVFVVCDRRRHKSSSGGGRTCFRAKRFDISRTQSQWKV